MLVHINSKFRDSGSFDDFVITLNREVKYNSVKLMDCVIPQSFYIFNSNNNTFTVKDQYNTLCTCTITPGSYTSSTLITALQSAINIGSSASQCTVFYLPDQNILKIQTVNPMDMLFSKSPSTAYVLGFNPVDTGPGLVHLSDNSLDLAPENYLYLQINGLGIPQCVGGISQSFTYHFPLSLNGNIYTVSKFASESDYKIKLSSPLQSCGQLQIKLLDQDGKLIGMRGDWGLTLLLSTSTGGCGCC